MSVLSYGILLGRHCILPFHDWMDEIEMGIERCHHCGISNIQSEKFWVRYVIFHCIIFQPFPLTQ
jgi:hypothetical protein